MDSDVDKYAMYIMGTEPDIHIKYIRKHVAAFADKVEALYQRERSIIKHDADVAGVEFDLDDEDNFHYDKHEKKYCRLLYDTKIVCEVQTDVGFPYITKINFDFMYNMCDKYGYGQFSRFIRNIMGLIEFNLLVENQENVGAEILINTEDDVYSVLPHVVNGRSLMLSSSILTKFLEVAKDDREIYASLFNVMLKRNMIMPQIIIDEDESRTIALYKKASFQILFGQISGRPPFPILVYVDGKMFKISEPTPLVSIVPNWENRVQSYKLNGTIVPIDMDIFLNTFDGARFEKFGQASSKKW